MLVIWALFIGAVGLYFYYKFLGKGNKKLENGLKELPGPKGLPLVGSLFEIGKIPNKQFCKWSEEFGGIYTIKLGGFKFVIVSDPKWCKEIFSDPLVTGRMTGPEFQLYEEHPGHGVFNSDGELWATHRRFLLRELRDLGFGKNRMENSIVEEVKEVLQMYKGQVGKPVSGIRETLRLAVVNALWTILSSERFEQSDDRLLKLANNVTKSFNEVSEKGALLGFIPWIKYILPERSGYNAVRRVLEDSKKFFVKSIDDHKKSFQEDELKDFIDVYLAEMKRNEGDPTSHFYGDAAERQLASIMFDLFLAGSDTTAITTAWTSLYLCKFPEVQKKFQEEISRVTMDTRLVSLADRPNMPYSVALIDEIFRFSSLAPDGVACRAMADREFQGYHIPKDAMVQPNLYFIHHNKNIWGDPENFRPERFLNEDGSKYVRNENLMPFQTGRRQCLGESLARDQVFLFLTNIFQQFSMEFVEGEEEPSMEPEVGFLRAPLPFSVIMTDRLAK